MQYCCFVSSLKNMISPLNGIDKQNIYMLEKNNYDEKAFTTEQLHYGSTFRPVYGVWYTW